MTGLVGWFDAGAGVSGDMMLGALVDAGVPVGALQSAVDAVTPGIVLRAEPTTRHGIGATRLHVEVPGGDQPHRHLADILALFGDLPEPVRAPAVATFTLLAEAEAAVHRTDAAHVHFHEVGALDAIADIVGACAGVAWLREHRGVAEFTVGPVEAGGGAVVRAAHGTLPVPVPAVLELARRRGLALTGRLPYEAATPTGVALLAALTGAQAPMPALRPVATGAGAGGRDPAEAANVLRLVLGSPDPAPARAPGAGPGDGPGTGPGTAPGEAPGEGATGAGEPAVEAAVVVECNVDDLDPRLWPGVLARLLDSGVADAWLSPILMKKGRPAHTLHVLCTPAQLPAVRILIYTETSTIGLREYPVTKRPLARTTGYVEVDGERIGVKVSRLDGRVTQVSVEYEDVRRAAGATGEPARRVLARAQAEADGRFRD